MATTRLGSADSWAGLLRDCKRRGMRAPVLAVKLKSRDTLIHVLTASRQ